VNGACAAVKRDLPLIHQTQMCGVKNVTRAASQIARGDRSGRVVIAEESCRPTRRPGDSGASASRDFDGLAGRKVGPGRFYASVRADHGCVLNSLMTPLQFSQGRLYSPYFAPPRFGPRSPCRLADRLGAQLLLQTGNQLRHRHRSQIAVHAVADGHRPGGDLLSPTTSI